MGSLGSAATPAPGRPSRPLPPASTGQSSPGSQVRLPIRLHPPPAPAARPPANRSFITPDHVACPSLNGNQQRRQPWADAYADDGRGRQEQRVTDGKPRSEEHTSELQSR